MKTHKGLVQKQSLAISAILNHDLKTATSSNQKLVTLLVGMGTTVFSGRNIIEVKHSLDVKGKFNRVLYGSYVSRHCSNARQLVYMTVENCHLPWIFIPFYRIAHNPLYNLIRKNLKN